MHEAKRALAIALAVLAFTLAPRVTVAGSSVPYRLVDHAGGKDSAGIIGGVFKRILDPFVDTHVFALEESHARSTLRFSVGLAPASDSGTVRFEVVLRPRSGNPITLYQRDMDAVGWVEGRVDLAAHESNGAQLVLRKQVLAGPSEGASRGFWGEPMLAPEKPPARPSIVLLSLDTLRADRVGAYGYPKARTPALDALAQDAVVYTEAYSASTWTWPSHASLLCGIPPAAFPSVDVSQFPPVPDREKGFAFPPSVFPEEPRPLPGILRDAGYVTAGFTGGGFLGDILGFSRGFDTYYTFEQPKSEPVGCSPDRFDGPEVFKRAIEWLRANHGWPFFLFVHTYDIHDRCPVLPRGLGPFAPWADPGAERRQQASAYYDDLVARTDRLVGDLLRELDALGLTKSAIITVTSDHGEGFWEHGFYGHGGKRKPYGELARVPLMVRDPSRPAEQRRMAAPVSAIDMAPTILKLIDEGVPSTMQGKALPGLGLPGERAPSEPVFVHCNDLLAVRVGRYKLITSRTGAFPDEVYDLDRDRFEKRNVLGKRASASRELQLWAAKYWQRASSKSDGQHRALKDLDETTRERLKALGYLE